MQKAAANDARIAKVHEEEERKETAEWSKGAKSSSKAEAEAAKKAALAAKKAEKAALEEAERAALPSKPAVRAPRGEDKKAAKRAGGGIDEALFASSAPGLSASNIDDALDALSLTRGGEGEERRAVAGIDRHPERRQKAALAAFEDRRLPELKKEHPGLRLQQYKDLIYKEFQKVCESLFLYRADVCSRRRIRLIRLMPRIMRRERTLEILLRQRNGRLSNDLRRKRESRGSFVYLAPT